MKKKISVCYSCSDLIHHEHKTKIGAWLCGRWQAFLFSQLSRLTMLAPDKGQAAVNSSNSVGSAPCG